jgi:putative membrane protein
VGLHDVAEHRLWTVLGLALAVTGGVVAARMLGGRHQPRVDQIGTGGSPGLDEARAALRLRYAHGEISREDYLQGKVELED